MRLLVVTHYYDDHQGGVEIVAAQLARRLALRGLQVSWAASGPAPNAAEPGIEYLAMRAWNGCERRWGVPYPLWTCRSLYRLWSAVGNSDVVHLHESLYLGNVIAFLAAAWFRKPLCVTQHVGDIPFRNWFLRCLYRLASHTVTRHVLSRARSVVFISNRVRNEYSRFVRFRGSVQLIPNGVDTGVFHPVSPVVRESYRHELGWTPDRLYLLFVGRFVEKKGLHLLRQLAEQFPQCTWVFVGWGPLDPQHWGLDNVICVGRTTQKELPRFYQSADLLLLPSVGEGFPLVVQEAMACGMTACLTDEVAQGLPGVREHAFLSPPDVADLSAVVARILQSPESLSGMKRAAASFAQAAWSWERCVSEYQDIFEELAGTRGICEPPFIDRASRHTEPSARP